MNPRVVHFYFPIFGTLFIPIDKSGKSSPEGRVVDLRYWLEKTAEAMLMLRSDYKSRRWNLLKPLSFSLV
jgi:hypothetical protein